MNISLEDGKYTLVFEEDTGKLYALRYGQEWRDCLGDGMVLAAIFEIDKLKSSLAAAEEKIKELEEIASFYKSIVKNGEPY